MDFLLALIELFSPGVTVQSPRAKRDRKSAISHQRGQFDPKFQAEGVAPPPVIFARLVRPMPYYVAADSFYTKKLCSRLSSSEVGFFLYGNRPFCFFETLFGNLGAKYDDYLRLIGKCVVDFLLALIELFR